jgi:cell division protein FtsB
MITSNNMDESISETETAPEAPPPPDFDATPWPVAQRPAARPPRPVRIPRDLGPRMWTAALAATLLFTAGGLALLYLDDTNSQKSANQLNAQNQALKSQNKQLQAQLVTTQTNLTATLSELATVRAELEHPHLTIWNVAEEIQGPDYYLAGGAPDTFTYHLQATSTGPMSISILTLQDFAAALDCVQNGRGRTNYCMHHTGSPVITWLGVTTVNYDFHAAEGCAGYVVVFTSAGDITVKPNVSVTYNPASASTGYCAK